MYTNNHKLFYKEDKMLDRLDETEYKVKELKRLLLSYQANTVAGTVEPPKGYTVMEIGYAFSQSRIHTEYYMIHNLYAARVRNWFDRLDDHIRMYTVN